jgi:enoyl-CoA hydratase
MARVRTDHIDGCAIVTLDDPDRRNALDLALSAELADTVTALDSDPGVHALIVTGAGPAFCAGADRRALAVADRDALRGVYAGFLAVYRCSTPTIAAVNGPAVGAGMNLALACDVRVAGESAWFESRFLQLPIHPGGGHTFLLQRAIGRAGAIAVCAFNEPLSGREAERLGLAHRCVPTELLVDSCLELARRLTCSPTPSLGTTLKQTIDLTASMDFEQALECELDRQLDSMTTPEFQTRIGARR